jgi:hypothetical protein
MSFDLSVTLKSGIAAKDRRERKKKTDREWTQMNGPFFLRSFAAIIGFVDPG